VFLNANFAYLALSIVSPLNGASLSPGSVIKGAEKIGLLNRKCILMVRYKI